MTATVNDLTKFMLAPNALTTVEAALTFLGLTEDVLDNNTTYEQPVTITQEDGTTITTMETVTVLSAENQQLFQQVAIAINAASAVIEGYCRRKFQKATYTQYIRTPSKDIVTQQYPLHELIEEATQPSLIEYLDHESGIVDFKRAVSGEIQYIAGYVLPKDATEEEPRTLPHDLELACLRVANVLYTDALDGYIGDVSDLKLGDWSTKISDSAAKVSAGQVGHVIPADVVGVLDAHRRVMYHE